MAIEDDDRKTLQRLVHRFGSPAEVEAWRVIFQNLTDDFDYRFKAASSLAASHAAGLLATFAALKDYHQVKYIGYVLFAFALGFVVSALLILMLLVLRENVFGEMIYGSEHGRTKDSVFYTTSVLAGLSFLLLASGALFAAAQLISL